MLNSFLKFTAGFILLILLGIGALALTSYAAPYLDKAKASVFESISKTFN